MADIQPVGIPNFSLGGPEATTDSIGKGAAAGLATGVQMGQNQAYLHQQQAKQAAQIKQWKMENALTTMGRVSSLYDSAPEETQAMLWPTLKDAIETVEPGVKLPDKAPDGGVKPLSWIVDQNQRFHDTKGKEGLSDMEAKNAGIKYIEGKSAKWARLGMEELNAAPFSQPKTPLSQGPGQPPVAYNASTGSASPLPGATPQTTGLPGGTSGAQAGLDLQTQFMKAAQPLHTSLNASYATKQLIKAAQKTKDATTRGDLEWEVLQNSLVALNPNIAQGSENFQLNQQTAQQLMKTGGIPEQLAGYLQQKSNGINFTDDQLAALSKTIGEDSKIKNTQMRSLINGFTQTGKSYGSNTDQVVTPIAANLPPESATNGDDEADVSEGAKKASVFLKGFNGR